MPLRLYEMSFAAAKCHLNKQLSSCPTSLELAKETWSILWKSKEVWISNYFNFFGKSLEQKITQTQVKKVLKTFDTIESVPFSLGLSGMELKSMCTLSWVYI